MRWVRRVGVDWCAMSAGPAIVAPRLGRGEGSSDKGEGAVRFKGHRPRAHRHQALAQVGGLHAFDRSCDATATAAAYYAPTAACGWQARVFVTPSSSHCCRTPGVNVFLVGMATPAEVSSTIFRMLSCHACQTLRMSACASACEAAAACWRSGFHLPFRWRTTCGLRGKCWASSRMRRRMRRPLWRRRCSRSSSP